MEENPLDDAAIINADVEEATNSNESSVEDTTDLADELERQRNANAQILARAKRAEEEIKKLKSTQAQPQNLNNNNPQLQEELKLIARGLSDEEIEKAKVIARGNGVSLTDAVKDEMFVLFQSNLKEKQRKENAKLGASRGSGETQEDTLIKPEMTREEHMAAFKKVNGK